MPTQDMLVNYVRGEECRVAIIEDGKLEEYYTERASADLHVGNIYRGKVTNVEPSIQAAFVDFGLERSGFLHISDLHPRYFPGDNKEEAVELVGQRTPRRERPPIQHCLRRGQEILVQVLKEGLGNKGPTLTSYLSIPGRFLVMMPHMERHGVSRKIEDPEKRRQMHQILDDLNPPENFGFIVRTAGIDRPKTELKRDLAFLLRLWKDMEHHMAGGRGPAELYVESDLVTRTLRDVITADVKRIIIDDHDVALRARQFLRLAMPRSATKVIHYGHPLPLFDAFDVERQIQSIHDRIVPMESGGSLVFDTTEALVAIDVNSGKSRENSDAETTAFKTNLEAVDEIARQLRLRDLGGLIVLDLIDMYKPTHRRDVEKRFRDNLKRDRARTKDLRISELGMLEMTRQRMRPSLKKSVFRECPTCHGGGLVLSLESVVLSVMRRLAVAVHAEPVRRIQVAASAEVLAALFNRRRESLTHMEKNGGKPIVFTVDPAAGPDTVTITCTDEKESPIDLSRVPRPKAPQFTEAEEISVGDLSDLGDLPHEEDFEDAEAVVMETNADADADAQQPAAKTAEPSGDPGDKPQTELFEGGEQPGGRKKRRRRRRGRGRRGASDGQGVQDGQPTLSDPNVEPRMDGDSQIHDQAPAEDRQQSSESSEPSTDGATASATDNGAAAQGEGRRRRRRRGGRRRGRGRGGVPNSGDAGTPDAGGSSGYVGGDAGPAIESSSSSNDGGPV